MTDGIDEFCNAVDKLKRCMLCGRLAELEAGECKVCKEALSRPYEPINRKELGTRYRESGDDFVAEHLEKFT